METTKTAFKLGFMVSKILGSGPMEDFASPKAQLESTNV